MITICFAKRLKSLERVLASLTILAMLAPSLVDVTPAFAQDTAAQGNYVWQMVGSGNLSGAIDPQQFQGYEFTPAKDGYVTELCGFFQGTHPVDLFDSSFNMLASISISGYEQWNCAKITPVAVKKQADYYAIAEIFSGTAYKQPAVLPQTSGSITIDAGVTQESNSGFGQKIKNNPNYVFGLVDVKFSSDAASAQLLIKAGASLIASVSQGADAATAADNADTPENTFKNCASGKCIICGLSGCRIADDATSKSQAAPTFIQTCAGGQCYSCTNGDCGVTDAAGIVKSGYSYKNCSQNKCLTCVNGDCITTGGSVPKYAYASPNGDLDLCLEWLPQPPGEPICVDYWREHDHSFSDWLGAYGDDYKGDVSDTAISQGDFLNDLASIANNSSGLGDVTKTAINGDINGLTFKNFSISIPELPGAVPTTISPEGTTAKQLFDLMNNKATGLQAGADALALLAPDSNLAKNMATAAIAYGKAATAVAQGLYNAKEQAKPSPKDSTFDSGTSKTAAQAILINENTLAVTSLLGVTINKNGQVMTDANGAPVVSAAVQASVIAATSGTNGTSDVFTTTWGKMPAFDQKAATVSADKLMDITKDVKNQQDIPSTTINGKGQTPVMAGSSVLVNEVDINGNIVGQATHTVTDAEEKAGQIQDVVVGSESYDRNDVVQKVTFGVSQTSAAQQPASTATTAPASPVAVQRPAASSAAVVGGSDYNNFVAMLQNNSAKVTDTTGSLTNDLNTPLHIMSYTAPSELTTQQLNAQGASQMNVANLPVNNVGSAANLTGTSSGAALAAIQTVADQSSAQSAAQATQSKTTAPLPAALTPTGGVAVTSTGTKLDQYGAQAAAKYNGYYDATQNSPGYGQVFFKDANGNPTNVVDTQATEEAKGDASGELWVTQDPNVLACDSVRYGADPGAVKEFSEQGGSQGSGAAGSGTTTAAGTTPATTLATTPASTQINATISQVNGNSITVKDSNNKLYVIADVTKAKITLNGSAVDATKFKFVAKDTISVTGVTDGGSIVATAIAVTRKSVQVLCPSADVCIPGSGSSRTTTDYANNGVGCPTDWSCIPKSNIGPIGIPLAQGSLELRFATLTLKDMVSGTGASLISALDKNDPQSPAKNDPPQIVDYQPRITDGKDTTITVKTDEKANCKYSPYDLPWDFMWNAMNTSDGLTHTNHIGAQADGTYIYYVQCRTDKGVSSNDYSFVYTVNKSYDTRIESDSTPPAVAGLTISKKSATLGDSETITARIGDNVGVDSALAQIKDSQGQYLAVMALNDNGLSGDGAANDGTWGYQWDTTSKPDGNYNITLVASDKSGNFSQVNGNADFSLASKVTGVKIGDAAACKQILNNGPSSDKLDVVFIPCGFGNDMQSFETAANAAVDKMFTVTQFSDNKQKFNITLAEVSDMACSDTLSADMDNDAVRFREAALPCNPDATIVLKKGGQDGGISLPGSRIVFMLAADPFLAAHELGHAYFRLNDEYSYGCTAADLKTSANCDDSPGCPKWKGLDGAKCVAGCTCEGNYRSSQDSVMVDPQNSTQFSPAAAKYVLSIFNLFK